MEKFSENLGFRLVASSILLAFATIFIAGYVVYERSQVAIVNSSLAMVREMSVDVAQSNSSSYIDDYMRRYFTSKNGSVWLIDSDGNILASTDLRFGGAAEGDTAFCNAIFRLKFAKKLQRFEDSKRTDIHLVTPLEIILKYEEGIAEYDYQGATRLVSFKVIPDKGWLLGVEKPAGVAYSELYNIKKYIVIVCIISIVMVSLFSWLAIRKIIQPYYKGIEDLNTRLGDSVRRLSTLHKVSRSMQRILPLEEMLEKSVRGIAEALGYERILLYLIDKENDETRLGMALIDGEISAPENFPEEVRTLSPDKQGGAIEKVIADHQPRIVRDALNSELVNRKRIVALGAREIAVAPLIAESKCIGAITVDNPKSKRPIREEDIETLATFANHLGLAIESGQRHTELQIYATDLATTDSLTGLSNWKHFIERLDEEILISKKDKTPLSVILIQVDRLMDTNKMFGYTAGNTVLKQVAQIIASVAVSRNQAARLGGGEFALGFPACSETRAQEIGEQLKESVADFRFEEQGLEQIRLCINVAVGEFEEDETARDFLERLRKMITGHEPA